MKHKIIFVDDEVNVLKALKRDMTEAGVAAEYFISAEVALAYLKQNQVDIVITDFNMPGMDGITFLRVIQQSYPEIYRIILSSTGVENLEFKEALLDRTIEQCFDKPWDVDALIAYFEKFKAYA